MKISEVSIENGYLYTLVESYFYSLFFCNLLLRPLPIFTFNYRMCVKVKHKPKHCPAFLSLITGKYLYFYPQSCRHLCKAWITLYNIFYSIWLCLNGHHRRRCCITLPHLIHKGFCIYVSRYQHPKHP